MTRRRANACKPFWTPLFTCASLFLNVAHCQPPKFPQVQASLFHSNGNASGLVVKTDTSATFTTTIKCISTSGSCLLPGNRSPDGYIELELPRLSQVSAVIVFHKHIQTNKGSMTVSVVRAVSSDARTSTDCELRYQNPTGSIFYCYESHELKRKSKLGILGNAIAISSVTVDAAAKGIQVHRGVLLSFRNQLVANDRIDTEALCLEPGRFPSHENNERWDKTWYASNESVSYPCDRGFRVGGFQVRSLTSRKCDKGEWLGNVPRCVRKSIVFDYVIENKQCLDAATEEPRYFFQRDSFELTSLSVLFETESRQACESARPQILISDGTTLREEVWNSSSTMFFDSDGNWCKFTFGPVADRRFNCNTNCTVLLNLAGVARLRTRCKFSLKGISADPELIEWLEIGCPPIDSYIGMPDEYAGEAARNHNELNRRLMEKPCRNGFRHVAQASIKQCVFSETSFEWTGESPKCRLITCKRPPSVQNADWHYLSNSTFHEVQYTCRAPWKTSLGDGIAKCNYEINAWAGVPTCVEDREGVEGAITSSIFDSLDHSTTATFKSYSAQNFSTSSSLTTVTIKESAQSSSATSASISTLFFSVVGVILLIVFVIVMVLVRIKKAASSEQSITDYAAPVTTSDASQNLPEEHVYYELDTIYHEVDYILPLNAFARGNHPQASVCETTIDS